jgi:ATP-dependent exoDNAse (exonuclease V) alpha subunit
MATQQEAIDLINSGKNVFLSGSAGVGKSHVINQIINNSTALCAPTGIAALNIGGATCHSLFQLPIGLITEEEKEKIPWKFREVFSNNFIKRIVIDEISMCRSDYFDLIDTRLKRIKNNDLPFGGLQIITVGDGFQLPPIVSNAEKRYFRRQYKSPYFFDSKVWNQAGFVSAILDKVYRQSDEEQILVLNKIRTKAEGWEQAVGQINDWCSAPSEEEQLTLCNYRKDANVINDYYYDKLKGKEYSYKAVKTGKFNPSDSIVEKEIKLKEGTRVVICANSVEGGYVNGERGVVLKCDPNSVVVELETGDIVSVENNKWERYGYGRTLKGLTKIVEGTFSQIPLLLGWAQTVHKCQGMTLDNCCVNLGKRSFDYHQSYVALSRVKNLKNMSLTRPIEYSDIQVDKRVVDFYDSLG